MRAMRCDGPAQAAAVWPVPSTRKNRFASRACCSGARPGPAVFHGQLQKALGLGHLQPHLRAIGL